MICHSTARKVTSINRSIRTGEKNILIPNEHGAWGMFFTAFLAGWLAAPALSWQPLLLLPAALGAFLCRYPVGLYFKKRRITRPLGIKLERERKWFLIYAALTLLAGIPLLYPLGWWWVVPVAGLASFSLALHLRAIIKRRERDLFVEMTAMIGISFLVPAAAYANRLAFDWKILWPWILFVLFYGQRIVAIKRKVARRKEIPLDIRKVGQQELLVSSLFFLAVILAARLFYGLPHHIFP